MKIIKFKYWVYSAKIKRKNQRLEMIIKHLNEQLNLYMNKLNE